MSASSWNEAVPAMTDRVGIFPQQGPSIWTSISIGMSASMFWDGSGGASTASGGELKPGGSRAFFAAKSTSSAPNSQMTGRAHLASDDSRLRVYDSNATYLAGTPYFMDYQTLPTAGGAILMQSGSTTTTVASGANRITGVINYPAPFQANPQVMLSLHASNGGPGSFIMASVFTSTTTFLQVAFASNIGSSPLTIH